MLAVVVATLLAGTGCSKSADKPAGNGPAQSAAAADSTGCAAGATKNVDGGFCMVVPATLKASDPLDKNSTSRTYNFKDGNGKTITVVVTKMDDAQQWDGEVRVRAGEASKATNKQQQTMDLPGGGKFWSWVEDDGETWVTVLAHKDTTLLFCRTAGNPMDPAFVDACKSIRPL